MSRRKQRFLTVECEGSNAEGHLEWLSDILSAGLMCTCCGQWFSAASTSYTESALSALWVNVVPDHKRADVIAMLERGDFDTNEPRWIEDDSADSYQETS